MSGKVSESLDNSATQKGQNTPKEGKKKKKNKTKEKNKPTSELKKRGHPSTPSNSDDSEKLQTEEWTNAEKSHDVNQAKGHTKERGSRKSRKCKPKQPVEDSAPPNTDKTDVSSQAQESLRWEGALEDPAAEEERLELYRANRRKRYMASRQTLLESVQVGLGTNTDISKLDRNQKTVATGKIL